MRSFNWPLIAVVLGSTGCGIASDPSIDDAALSIEDAAPTIEEAGTTDIGDPLWIPCPPAWPPSPPIVYCGAASGISCYEFPQHTLCRGVNYVVLMPTGDQDCASCAAIGVHR